MEISKVKFENEENSLKCDRVTNEEKEMIFNIFKEDMPKRIVLRKAVKHLKRYIKKVFAFIMIFAIFVGCNKNVPEFSAIKDAKEIRVKEVAVSIGKKYKIYADGVQIGYVKGKALKIWGDKFEMYDMNDNKILEEVEVKRILRLNRTAEIRDNEKNVVGYIGEQTFSKVFSIGYTFHFYDKDKNQLGISDEVNISLLKKNNFKDNEGNIDYKVNAKLDIFDVYDIEVIDEDSSIPPEFTVFMVCIEDAIKDAEKKEKEEEKKKKNS